MVKGIFPLEFFFFFCYLHTDIVICTYNHIYIFIKIDQYNMHYPITHLSPLQIKIYRFNCSNMYSYSTGFNCLVSVSANLFTDNILKNIIKSRMFINSQWILFLLAYFMKKSQIHTCVKIHTTFLSTRLCSWILNWLRYVFNIVFSVTVSHWLFM